MKIPEKVKIGGYVVTVCWKNGLMDYRGNLGEYHRLTQEIWLDEALTEQCREEIFIHEMLEAIKDIYSLDYPHEILNLNGVVLHTIINDNPDIFMAGEETNVKNTYLMQKPQEDI